MRSWNNKNYDMRIINNEKATGYRHNIPNMTQTQTYADIDRS